MLLLLFLVPVISVQLDQTAIVAEDNDKGGPGIIVRSSLPSYPSTVRSSREVLESSKRKKDNESEVNNFPSNETTKSLTSSKNYADFCTMDGLFCVPANYSK